MTSYDDNLIRKNPTEHLSLVPSGRMEQHILLIHLNRRAKQPEIMAAMDTLHVRPVLSAEFLALTTVYPDLQRTFPHVGLGSVWVGSGGGRDVLYAYEISVRRYLGLNWDGNEWAAHCRFPAVCKS